jgi:hypothetical protein
MEEKDIKNMYEIIINEINKKKWYDLSIHEINMIEDIKKRNEYLKEYYFCFRNIINPLYNSINTNKYKFTEDMSCKQIVNQLKEIYYKKGKTKEEMREIIFGRFKTR